MKKSKFDIKGMTCSSCSSHVERAVCKLQGYKNVNVNLLSNNMIVEYDENELTTEEIIQAVNNAGYVASLSNSIQKTKKEEKINDIYDDIQHMKIRLITSICFLIPLMYIAMGHMLHLPISNFLRGNENILSFGFTQFLLLLPIIYVNRNYFIVGFKRLFSKTPNMDSLIAIGSSAATVYGIFVIYMLSYGLGHNDLAIIDRYAHDLYFESAGTILTLITLGKYLETKSKGKTSDAINKLINLAPKTASVIRNEKEIELPLEEIIIGDIINIKPGGSVPVDGVVIEGNSSVDESSITGESIPVEKSNGNVVIAGTINKNGYLKVKATKVGNDTTLSQIIRLVEEAGNSKAPIAKIADKVSGVFVPVVITIAVLATIIWLFLGQSFEFALTIGISVLVISCPCALGLATPVAIMVGTGKGAENGILIKSAESLELLHLVDTVVLDKTGTITVGKPEVTDIFSDINESELLMIAGSLEKNSEHPLAEAILRKVADNNIELSELKEFLYVPGRGVKGQIDGFNYYGGNLTFMKENKVNLANINKKEQELLSQGKTLLYFAKETEIIGVIAVSDTVKDTSLNAIKRLKEKNLEVFMLTGDNSLVAQTIAKTVKIDNVISEVMPQDKEKEVSKLQLQGKKVAFVGDGINDSPALVKADVGIAIGSGTDIAIESADVVLMKSNLEDVVNAIDLSKAVIRNIKVNLFWAFFYNAIGIPIAAGVFYNSFNLRLNPMLGALAMSLSSVCVVSNALRLRKFKIKYDKGESKMTKIISIDGMQCNHCKMTVEKVLGAVDGISSVNVNLEEKTATVEMVKDVDDAVIKNVIEEAGFVVKGIDA